MTSRVGDPTTSATSTVGRPRRWGARTRKALLALHLISSGAWIGIDVVLGVLVATALLGDDAATSAVVYQALRLFAVWPLLVVGLLCLASGVALGLGSKYGLLRYRWVAIKLVLTVALVVLGMLALRPDLDRAAVLGRAPLPGDAPDWAVGLMFAPVVSTTCLVVAVLLSVYKPWGRLRRGARP